MNRKLNYIGNLFLYGEEINFYEDEEFITIVFSKIARQIQLDELSFKDEDEKIPWYWRVKQWIKNLLE